MLVRSIATFPLLALSVLAVLEAPVSTQALEKKYFEDKTNGFKFRYPKGWNIIPPKPADKEIGKVGRLEGEKENVNVGNSAVALSSELNLFVFPDQLIAPMTGKAAEKAGKVEKSGNRKGKERQDIGDLLPELYRMRGYDKDETREDRAKKIKKIEVRHRVWEIQANLPLIFDTWTFDLPDQDVCMLFIVPEARYKKMAKGLEACAKSFTLIEREEAREKGGDYESLIEFYAEEASRTPGWRVLPTPSERFILKTSSDNKKFLGLVIERLEHSRDLFERDFPPETPIEHVSVVRVCKSEEEFHAYGGTSGGVVGWFNPSSKELVLFDASHVDRNVTFAVMTHEAFHQYCHFLFDESEANRWFDEGHGDYYGAFEFKGKKALVGTRMPSGLDRLSVIRELVSRDTWIPLETHLKYTHPEWQRHGVPSYAQSWSIVYMLRQGMLGDVPRKCWEPEYADIIPNYMEALHTGFQEAYETLRKEVYEEAEAEGRIPTEEDLDVRVPLQNKKAIWGRAYKASWGQIDLEEFQGDWLIFVDKYLK